jgi:hypothetical protein
MGYIILATTELNNFAIRIEWLHKYVFKMKDNVSNDGDNQTIDTLSIILWKPGAQNNV